MLNLILYGFMFMQCYLYMSVFKRCAIEFLLVSFIMLHASCVCCQRRYLDQNLRQFNPLFMMQPFLNDLQVAYLLLADTLNTAFTAAILYEYLIAHYGEPLGEPP